MSASQNTINNADDICVVDDAKISAIKAMAKQASMRRARLCMHQSHADQIQEMIIAFCHGSEVPVHRHAKGKTESFHVIEGRLTVKFFDDEGRLENSLALGDHSSERPSIYRLATDQWHTLEIESEIVVLHEVATGPFDQEHTEIHPMYASK